MKLKIKLVDEILYFENEHDGHSYTKTFDEWVCYPTNSDGTIDRNEIIFCDDLDPGVSDEDRAQLREYVEDCESFLEIYNRDLCTLYRQCRENNYDLGETDRKGKI